MQGEDYLAYLKKQSYEDLVSISYSIDREAQPKRYKMVLAEIAERDKIRPAEKLSDDPAEIDRILHSEVSDKQKQIPEGERNWHIVLSLFLVIYGTHGFLANDIFITGKHGHGTHLHGAPMVLMFFAMICAATSLMTIVVDYYDQRDNDKSYRSFARIAGYFGWTFFGLSLALSLYQSVNR